MVIVARATAGVGILIGLWASVKTEVEGPTSVWQMVTTNAAETKIVAPAIVGEIILTGLSASVNNGMVATIMGTMETIMAEMD